MFILTDEQLIAGVREGDSNAFKELVKRYESRVAATVIGILGNCPEADDVGQETFIRFYKGLEAFRRESSASTYLVRIAINLSLNELKRRKRRPSPFSQTTPATIYDIPDEKADKSFSQDKRVVEQALQNLKPDFRAVIVLRLIDGYSTEETARILDVPVGTVLSRLARAQVKLRKLLTPYWGRHNEQKDA
jgi:RNA polymerase sigma-70 factor (ECF subfamily)